MSTPSTPPAIEIVIGTEDPIPQKPGPFVLRVSGYGAENTQFYRIEQKVSGDWQYLGQVAPDVSEPFNLDMGCTALRAIGVNLITTTLTTDGPEISVN